MKLPETDMKKGRMSAADLVIDFEAGIVEKDGQTLILSDLTWRTLCCLAHRRGAVVTLDELIKSVWGDMDITNETVSQRIKLLRRELGDDGQNPRYIGTVRNRGFRFLPSIESAEPRIFKKAYPPLFVLTIVAIVVVGFAIYLRPAAIKAPENSEIELARIIERAKEYLSRLSDEDNQIAISLYEEALRRDGDNHGAIVGLSFAFTHNATKFNYPLEWALRGERLARQAIEIETNARAYHALAFTFDAQGQIDEALRYYEMALSLDPDNAATLSSAAYLYQVRGQLARSIEYGMRAHRLNPDIAFTEVQIAASLHLLERDAEASEWVEQGLLMKPDNVFIHSVKANILFSHGRKEDALRTIERAIEIGIDRPELFILQGLIAIIDERTDDARNSFLAANSISPSRHPGDPYIVWLDLLSGVNVVGTEAQIIIASVIEDQNAGIADPSTLLVVAGLYAAMKDEDAALAVLNEAVDAGHRDWRMIKRHPMFTSLHTDHRFEVVLDRMRTLVSAER